MQFALFLGCTIPARLPQYEVSANSVFKELGIETIEIRDFNCCGYPFRNYDYKSFLLSSARNLALAAREGLDIITLCKCCFGNLKKVLHLVNEDPAILDELNVTLAKEDLMVDINTNVKHFLSVLYHDIGINEIKIFFFLCKQSGRVSTKNILNHNPGNIGTV